MEDEWKLVKPKKINTTTTNSTINTNSTSTIPPQQKIKEPCWFFNTGGCKNRDGTDKPESECKYIHVYSNNIKRPPHLSPVRPCDKHNIEGYCRWGDYCKYSHRNLSQEEWGQFYPNVPFILKSNNQKRQLLEVKIGELESRINILEYKLKSMDEYYEKTLAIIRRNFVHERALEETEWGRKNF